LPAGYHDLESQPHSPAAAYHPQSNGLVERFHRRLKDALQSRAAAAYWHNHIPWVLLGIRAAYREDSEFSLKEAVYGSQMILPAQFINTAESAWPSFLSNLQTTMTGHPPPPARHNTAPGLSTLPEKLLLARFGDLWWRTICSYCDSRLNRHVTYYSSHMLYIWIYPP
jgi:hypothetical protein